MKGNSVRKTLTGVKAGYAKVDITPPVGGLLSGFGFRDIPSTGVHTPLYVRTLFLAGSEGNYALSSCDIIGFTAETMGRVLERVREFGLSRDNYLIAVTHTHAGPVTIPLCGEAITIEQEDALVEAIGRSVSEAKANPQDAEVAIAEGRLEGVAVNRRAVDEHGRVEYVPDKVNPGGPVDDSLNTVWVRLLSTGVTVCVSSFSCHPISLTTKDSEEKGLISADFPGVAAGLLEPNGVELIHFVGGIGNINPVYLCAGRERCEELGKRYADVVAGQRSALRFTPLDRIDYSYRCFDLATEEPMSVDELMSFRAEQSVPANDPTGRTFEEYMHAKEAVFYCDYYLEMDQRGVQAPNRVEAPVRALSIGGAIILGFPFETFVEMIIRLRAEHAGQVILPIGLAGIRLGYLPTEEAYTLGGYEVERAHIADLSPAPYRPETEHILIREMTKAIADVERARLEQTQ